MRTFTMLLSLLLITMVSFGQNERNCATLEHMDYLIQQDPQTIERMDQIEAFTQQVIANGNAERAVDGVITIPVVVHVLWNVNKPQENISDAQIQSQIDVMNEDFRRLNADAANTLPDFVDVATDMEIEFCLASVDPQGNPTTGIERKSSTRGSWGTGTTMKRTAQGGFDAWPMTSYLNMWSCNIGGGILGFATFPGGAGANDGVVSSPQFFGSSDYDTNNDFFLSSPYDLGRTMTHEVGHWLNLRHIWGDGGCGVDDFVGDTPKSDNSNYGCPLTHQSCGTLDMVQNYMDYTEDACMNIYTEGQKARARALFDGGGVRAALVYSEGCGTPEPICLPVTGVDVNEGDNELVVNFNGAYYADYYTLELAYDDVIELFTIEDPQFGEISNITYTFGSLTTCTEYGINIIAHCHNLNGDEETGFFTATTTGPECVPPTCDTPENLYSTDITFTQATLGWDAVEAATGYKAEGRLVGLLGLIRKSRVVSSNSFRTNNLFPFLTYEFRVQSICEGIGYSPYSGWHQFTLNPFLREGGDAGVVVDNSNLEVVKLFDTDGIVTAFPNPSQGQVALNYYGQNIDDVRLVVTDITGKELKSYDFDLVFNGIQQVDLTDLQRGLYMLTYKKDGIILNTEKVMIAR
ncbi:MAG: T9SS type A sorting domain-containing protein [Bacteroidetes bacterium]|nr:T9SS type A sorting domain-containing protein [Bacteroidota bacterium]